MTGSGTCARACPLIKSRLGKGNPLPLRQPMPIMIGGGGEKVTLRIVAEHADIWHSFGDLETFEHKSGILDERCREIGRDPSEIERSVGSPTGKLDSETLDRYVALGASFFTAGCGGPDWNLDALKQLVAYRDSVNG